MAKLIEKIIIILSICAYSNLFGQEIREVYIGDTSNVRMSINIDVTGEIIDTSYSIKYPDFVNVQWKVYYYTFPKVLALDYLPKNDTSVLLQYHKNGQLSRKVVETNTTGIIYIAKWCNDGSLTYEMNYYPQMPPKLYTDYYCNGNKRLEYIFHYYRATGKCKKWFPNGQLKIDAEFDSNGLKTGIWKYYNEKGTPEKEEIYKEDKLIDTYMFKNKSKKKKKTNKK